MLNGHECSVDARHGDNYIDYVKLRLCLYSLPPAERLPTADRAQKCMMLMSVLICSVLKFGPVPTSPTLLLPVTTQTIFPRMSDARAPAMDVQMAPQGAAIALSFYKVFLSDDGDGYTGRFKV